MKERTMASRMFSGEQKAKLTQLVNEGIQVMQEVEDLNAGLSDTIKAVAEELEIKPAILKKAIKIAQKSKFTDTNADHEELTDILETVGRTL
jgi:transposase-like protein